MGTRDHKTVSPEVSQRPVAALFILAGVAVAIVGLAINNRYITLATGTFHPVAGTGSGWVRVTSRRARQQLELIDVRLQDGSDVEVRLMAASDVWDTMTAESTASRTAGILPSGTPTASFAIEPPVDLHRFRAITLWSPAKHLNLLTAPLRTPEQPFLGAREQ